jgi:hypothetical protein
MDYNDLVDLVNSHDETISDLGDNLDDLSGSFDDYTNENDANIQDLQNSQGTLNFPLDPTTADIIHQEMPNNLLWLQQNGYLGTAVLVAGTVTITSPLITDSSLVLVAVATKGGTQGILSYTTSTGSLVINSSSATDTSTVLYLILIP